MKVTEAYPRIQFQGAEYILVGDDGGHSGAITKAADYARGRVSYAHLMPDGRVMRFGEEIGHRENIQWLDVEVVEVPDVGAAVAELLGGKSREKP